MTSYILPRAAFSLPETNTSITDELGIIWKFFLRSPFWNNSSISASSQQRASQPKRTLGRPRESFFWTLSPWFAYLPMSLCSWHWACSSVRGPLPLLLSLCPLSLRTGALCSAEPWGLSPVAELSPVLRHPACPGGWSLSLHQGGLALLQKTALTGT